MVMGIEIQKAVGVCGFAVDRNGNRSIFFSCCFRVKKSNETFFFHLYGKLNEGIDGLQMCVEFIHVFLLQAHMTIVNISEPSLGRTDSR